MKCAFDISSFPDEVSSLTLSVAPFLCFSSLFMGEALVSPCCSLELCVLLAAPCPFSLAFHSSSLELFVEPPQMPTLPSCFSFNLGRFCFLPPVPFYGPLSVVLQAFCLLDLIPSNYSSPQVHIHRGFDLSCTWLASWFSLLSLL